MVKAKSKWSRLLLGLIALTVFFIVTYLPVAAQEGQPIGGIIYGTVHGFDMDDKLIPLGWATITIMKDGEIVAVGYSADGYYEIIVPGGELTITIDHPGYISQTVDLYVSPASSTALNFSLERSEEPIPEYPIQAAPIMLVVALLALLMISRKKLSRR